MRLRVEKLKRDGVVDGFEWAIVDNRGHLVATMATKGNSKSAERLSREMTKAWNEKQEV